MDPYSKSAIYIERRLFTRYVSQTAEKGTNKYVPVHTHCMPAERDPKWQHPVIDRHRTPRRDHESAGDALRGHSKNLANELINLGEFKFVHV